MQLLRLRTVLVATDLTETTDAALVSAARLVAAAGATLHVVHVTSDASEMVAASGRRSEFDLAFRGSLDRAGVDVDWERLHLVGGETAAAIGDVGDRVEADVIVLGRAAEGTLPTDRPIGGTAYAVIAASGAPCLCVMRPLELPATRVLVAIDHSAAARGALVTGLSWASALRSRSGHDDKTTLIALHVATGSESSADFSRAARDVDHELDLISRNAAEWGGVGACRETVTARDPAEAIVRFAREHDCQLIVLGTRSVSTHDGRALGSVSAGVLSLVDTPVLLVPPAIWGHYAKEIDYF